jgi:hypothetical protein
MKTNPNCRNEGKLEQVVAIMLLLIKHNDRLYCIVNERMI